jgi:hypothetical protein
MGKMNGGYFWILPYTGVPPVFILNDLMIYLGTKTLQCVIPTANKPRLDINVNNSYFPKPGTQSRKSLINNDDQFQNESISASDLEYSNTPTPEKDSTQLNTNFSPLPGCQCHRLCSLKLSTSTRQQILDKFLGFDMIQKNIFLKEFINSKQPKVKVLGDNIKAKTVTRVYHLPVDKAKVQVCKVMFMATLHMKNDAIIETYFRREKRGIGFSSRQIPIGKHRRNYSHKKRIIKEFVREFYHPTKSHYRSNQCPHRLYLSPTLNIKIIYERFKVERVNLEIGYSTFCRIFRKLKFSFSKPNLDQCQVCIDNKEHKHIAQGIVCRRCDKYQVHIHNAKVARELYRIREISTSNDNTLIFAVDLEKVIPLPKFPTKNSIFCGHEICYNETFAELNGRGDHCVVWHEAISDRSAAAITSSFLKLLDHYKNINNFLFWADNCVAQNKNWTLFYALLHIVHKLDWVHTIEIRFFEPGHTYMRPDAVHGHISRAMAKNESILTFPELCTIIQNTYSNIKLMVMHEADFLAWPKKINSKVQLPKLNPIRNVLFRKDSSIIYWKHDLSQIAFNETQINIPFSINDLPGRAPINGIDIRKKKEILKVLPSTIRIDQRNYWISLPEKTLNK